MATDTKRFVDDGWAVWTDENCKTAVYFTEWLNPKGENYVDIGVWTYEMKKSCDVHIFVPFPLEFSDINDLSPVLFTEKGAKAVFNTAFSVEKGGSGRCSRFVYDKKPVDLLRVSQDTLRLENVGGGTLLTARIAEYLSDFTCGETYIFFRLPHKRLNELFLSKPHTKLGKESLKELITSPMVTQRFGYSLGLNEERILPREIFNNTEIRRQDIQKAQLTIMIDEDYELNDGGCSQIRHSDGSAYAGYAPKNFENSNFVCYQWRQSRAGENKSHSNFYTVIQNSFISRKSVLVYGLILMFTSILGSAAYDLVKFLIELI